MPLFFQFLLLGLFGLALFGLFRFLVSRMPENRYYKYGIGLCIVAGFLLFWMNGAVGIIGSENNDANMMYPGLLLLSFLASLAVRFKPRGMVWVMRGSAVALIAIAIIALVFNVGVSGPVWPWDVIWISGFFVALLLFAGWLFQKAADIEEARTEGVS